MIKCSSHLEWRWVVPFYLDGRRRIECDISPWTTTNGLSEVSGQARCRRRDLLQTARRSDEIDRSIALLYGQFEKDYSSAELEVASG